MIQFRAVELIFAIESNCNQLEHGPRIGSHLIHNHNSKNNKRNRFNFKTRWVSVTLILLTNSGCEKMVLNSDFTWIIEMKILKIATNLGLFVSCVKAKTNSNGRMTCKSFNGTDKTCMKLTSNLIRTGPVSLRFDLLKCEPPVLKSGSLNLQNGVYQCMDYLGRIYDLSVPNIWL